MKKVLTVIAILVTATLLMYFNQGQADNFITYPGEWEVSTSYTFDEVRREGLLQVLDFRSIL
ncbi:hypothetical protein P4475_18190 [Halalkalibacterium halodurans]|uniref:hypothetical protein n=1 Tax=Halalkalibacterium halodurans TaxID=86665 RepID=UPI002E1BA5BD|nr:hypothetical protein [Halalkalibacterium halodurans]